MVVRQTAALHSTLASLTKYLSVLCTKHQVFDLTLEADGVLGQLCPH